MGKIKGKDYYILNLNLGKFVLDETNPCEKLKLSTCKYSSIRGAVKVWNTCNRSGRWNYLNIHTPALIEEFELVEIKNDLYQR